MNSDLEVCKPFLNASSWQDIHPGKVHLIGFPFDGTTSYRAGSRQGPDALREASINLESYSPYLNLDMEALEFGDLGNIPHYPSSLLRMLEHWNNLTANLTAQDKVKFISLGGEHSVSNAPLLHYLRLYPDLVIVHLDAHADLRDDYLGEKLSHASVIKRALDNFSKDNLLLQYGIRSGTKDEFSLMHNKGTLINSLEDLLDNLNSLNDSRPVYLTLDLDFFDPSVCPGTGTPEAGGEDFISFVEILSVLKNKNLVGADVVELAPCWDTSGRSNCLAAKVTRELILALGFHD